jgi:hypothetical protein
MGEPCTKEAEIATLKAHLETYNESNREHHEEMRADLKDVLIILRGDGNGSKGLVPRVVKIEEKLLNDPASDGDCFYLRVGKANLKIPVSKTAVKALVYGALLILVLTDQLSIKSPLAQDTINALLRTIGG